MLKDHRLNISLVFSFLWHLMLACMITIVIGTIKTNQKASTTVAFLGQLIPQENRFVVDLTKTPRPLEPKEQKLKSLYDDSYLTLNSLERESEFWQDTLITKRLKVPSAELEIAFEKEKLAPTLYHMLGVEKTIKTMSSEFEGLLAEREVIYKPDITDFLSSLMLVGEDADLTRASLILKVYVASDGRVAKVEKLVSSGLPEFDRLGIKYLRLWQFVAISKRDEPFMCGTIKLDLSVAE